MRSVSEIATCKQGYADAAGPLAGDSDRTIGLCRWRFRVLPGNLGAFACHGPHEVGDNMEKLFKVRKDVGRFQTLCLPGDESDDLRIYNMFRDHGGKTLPVIPQLIRAPDEARREIGDFPNLHPSALVCSLRAFSALSFAMYENCVTQSTDIEGAEYKIAYVRYVNHESEKDLIGAFICANDYFPMVFRIKGLSGGTFFREKLVQAYGEAGLTGLLFEPIVF